MTPFECKAPFKVKTWIVPESPSPLPRDFWYLVGPDGATVKTEVVGRDGSAVCAVLAFTDRELAQAYLDEGKINDENPGVRVRVRRLRRTDADGRGPVPMTTSMGRLGIAVNPRIGNAN